MDLKSRDIPAELFVKLWAESASLRELAEKTGRMPKSCTVRAAALRKRGYQLEYFKRGPQRKYGGGIVHAHR